MLIKEDLTSRQDAEALQASAQVIRNEWRCMGAKAKYS